MRNNMTEQRKDTKERRNRVNKGAVTQMKKKFSENRILLINAALK